MVVFTELLFCKRRLKIFVRLVSVGSKVTLIIRLHSTFYRTLQSSMIYNGLCTCATCIFITSQHLHNSLMNFRKKLKTKDLTEIVCTLLCKTLSDHVSWILCNKKNWNSANLFCIVKQLILTTFKRANKYEKWEEGSLDITNNVSFKKLPRLYH